MKITKQYIENTCKELNEFLKWIDCKTECFLDDQNCPCILFTERITGSKKEHIFYEAKEIVLYLIESGYLNIPNVKIKTSNNESVILMLERLEDVSFKYGDFIGASIYRKFLEILKGPTLKHILFNDEHYLVSENEIMACYQYQKSNYETEDARSHIEEFIYGTSKDALTEDEVKEAEEEFEKTYFIKPSCLFKENIVDEVVRRFEHDHDCNMAENDLYYGIIMDIANKKWKYDD